jgi:uncharacterized protein (DUF1499 family)
MKLLGYTALILLGLTVALLLAGQLGFLAGQTPADLGVHDGRMKAPSATPNSVSSQANLYPDHPQRVNADIAPLRFTGDGAVAMQKLAGIVRNTKRCVIVNQSTGYLYAQCTTALLRFTDDVEFWLDTKEGVIQLRSASRLGKGDLGANRSRMEKIRAQFQKN